MTILAWSTIIYSFWLFNESRHLGSSTAANWVSFDLNVSCSSCWGYSLINTLKLKKKMKCSFNQNHARALKGPSTCLATNKGKYTTWWQEQSGYPSNGCVGRKFWYQIFVSMKRPFMPRTHWRFCNLSQEAASFHKFVSVWCTSSNAEGFCNQVCIRWPFSGAQSTVEKGPSDLVAW